MMTYSWINGDKKAFVSGNDFSGHIRWLLQTDLPDPPA